MSRTYFAFEQREEPLSPAQEERRQKTIELGESLANFASSLSLDPEDFFYVLSMQHRTIQQSVTRLFMKWMEFMASPDYKTDPRNIASKNLAEELVALVKREHDLPYSEKVLSGMLPHI